MLVNMMVKNHITSTKPLITGDIDEVRVQSEEPNFKTRLRQLKRVFAIYANRTIPLRGRYGAAPIQSHARCTPHPADSAPSTAGYPLRQSLRPA